MFTQLPTDIKLSAAKEIFGIVSHILKRGYIDPFGMVTGESKHDAFLPIFTIRYTPLINLFANTVMDFDEIYKAFGYARKDLLYAKDSDSNIHFKTSTDDFEATALYTQSAIEFPKYNNPHIFKQSNSVTTLNVEEFALSIKGSYTYRDDQYFITREAVPKPAKILCGSWAVVDEVPTDDGKYIYYTTELKYDNVDLKIASVCYGI